MGISAEERQKIIEKYPYESNFCFVYVFYNRGNHSFRFFLRMIFVITPYDKM